MKYLKYKDKILLVFDFQTILLEKFNWLNMYTINQKKKYPSYKYKLIKIHQHLMEKQNKKNASRTYP